MDVARKEKIATFFTASPRLRALNREWANRLRKAVKISGWLSPLNAHCVVGPRRAGCATIETVTDEVIVRIDIG